MRLKDYGERDGKRVWLSESEIGLLLGHTDPEQVVAAGADILADLRGRDIVVGTAA